MPKVKSPVDVASVWRVTLYVNWNKVNKIASKRIMFIVWPDAVGFSCRSHFISFYHIREEMLNRSCLYLYFSECSDDPNYADICPTKAAIDGYCAFHRQFMQQLCCKSCRFQ